jgi:hypothetical protein
MSTAARVLSPVKDFREQLSRPRWPLIFTPEGLQGVIVESAKDCSAPDCEQALDALIEDGAINNYECFLSEPNGTRLYILLRPIRASGPGAGQDQS